jgi:prepilin-type N-terminal cleavage/methylation domain-containing protein
MKTESSGRGFTLIEMTVVLAIFMMVALFTFPKILSIANRSRIEGTTQQAAMLMRSVRLQAIKRNCYGVVMILPADRRVLAFLDVDRDGYFDPEDAQPDILVGVVELPFRVFFRDADGDEGLASVEDFDNPEVPVDLPDQQAMYREDGSILKTGALRFGDDRGNLLEVNVPKTSGIVEIRKHEGGQYRRKGENTSAWTFQ